MVRTTSQIEEFKKQKGDWRISIVKRGGTVSGGITPNYDIAFEKSKKIKANDWAGDIISIVVITPRGDEITLVL